MNRALPPCAWVALASMLACSSDSGSDIANESSGEAGSAGSESSTTGLEPMHGAINGTCVESGVRFLDVYTCQGVMGPAPTEPAGAMAQVDHDPSVLSDPDYAWVREQIDACSCMCCHSAGGIGTYRWSGEFEPAWTDSASDAILDTLGFGGRGNDIDAAENFGFSRNDAALPTTDAPRLQGFIDRELTRRSGG